MVLDFKKPVLEFKKLVLEFQKLVLEFQKLVLEFKKLVKDFETSGMEAASSCPAIERSILQTRLYIPCRVDFIK
jgi:hypothetical protein